ncbi:MAG: diadenylate cyclase CdaA [Spirochaetia bacterium]|nr:diadenylate cyclase CdaA [Spirochaetia bacterium]
MDSFEFTWITESAWLRSLIDIVLVSFLIYQIYRLLSHSRALPVLIGVVVFIILSLISQWFKLDTLSWLFESISGYLIIAIIVILQPELRRAFYRLGHVNIYKLISTQKDIPVEEVSQACLLMAEDKIGALLVLLKKSSVKQISESGISMQANISKELLVSIFYGENPLHDGAVIIEGEHVISAATYLPLSSSSRLKKTHGARHRAGLGITEESDVLSIIVSEETGKISVCFLGKMEESVNGIKLKSILASFNTGRLKDEWKTILK